MIKLFLKFPNCVEIILDNYIYIERDKPLKLPIITIKPKISAPIVGFITKDNVCYNVLFEKLTIEVIVNFRCSYLYIVYKHD